MVGAERSKREKQTGGGAGREGGGGGEEAEEEEEEATAATTKVAKPGGTPLQRIPPLRSKSSTRHQAIWLRLGSTHLIRSQR